MARGINKVILIGNLGNDPDTRYTQSGLAVSRVSLATTTVRKDRDGANQEKTEWHRVVFFGKLAEVVNQYLRKGRTIYVEGSIRYEKYTGQDGIERYSTDIVASEMQMLGGRHEGNGNSNDAYADRPPRAQAAPRNRPAADQASMARPSAASIPMDDMDDDDVPF